MHMNSNECGGCVFKIKANKSCDISHWIFAPQLNFPLDPTDFFRGSTSTLKQK